MKRLIGASLAFALGLSTVVAVASPAAGHSFDVCAGQGTASTLPVYYPTFGPSAIGGVSFTFTIGGCFFEQASVANGGFIANFVGNYCGTSQGTLFFDGHQATWMSAGGMMIFTPSSDSGPGTSMAGIAYAIPNAFNGQSCVTGATEFLVTGAVLLF